MTCTLCHNLWYAKIYSFTFTLTMTAQYASGTHTNTQVQYIAWQHVYADDILLYRPITCQGDFAALQEDINKLDSWIEANYLQFNISKCEYMVVSQKRAGISLASLTLVAQCIELCWTNNLLYQKCVVNRCSL